jgi:hypothetical protein
MSVTWPQHAWGKCALRGDLRLLEITATLLEPLATQWAETQRMSLAETYRAKALEYESVARTTEPPFRDALLDVARKWRQMADDAEISSNPNHAFAERLRRSLGLCCL